MFVPQRLLHELHTGMQDCLRMLQSCFRIRMSGTGTSVTWSRSGPGCSPQRNRSSLQKGYVYLNNQYRVFNHSISSRTSVGLTLILGSSAFCSILLRQIGFRQNRLNNQAKWWNISNLNQPNPGLQADATPCSTFNKMFSRGLPYMTSVVGGGPQKADKRNKIS